MTYSLGLLSRERPEQFRTYTLDYQYRLSLLQKHITFHLSFIVIYSNATEFY